MLLTGVIPSRVKIRHNSCNIWYRGQPKSCRICRSKDHEAPACPLKDKCIRCHKPGHKAKDCRNPWGRPNLDHPGDSETPAQSSRELPVPVPTEGNLSPPVGNPSNVRDPSPNSDAADSGTLDPNSDSSSNTPDTDTIVETIPDGESIAEPNLTPQDLELDVSQLAPKSAPIPEGHTDIQSVLSSSSLSLSQPIVDSEGFIAVLPKRMKRSLAQGKKDDNPRVRNPSVSPLRGASRSRSRSPSPSRFPPSSPSPARRGDRHSKPPR